MSVVNYNSPPQVFIDDGVLDPIDINEDEDTEILFDYNLLSDSNLFYDLDDCSFNVDTAECVGYYRYKCDPDPSQAQDDLYFDSQEDCILECPFAECTEDLDFFSVSILQGENYTSDGANINFQQVTTLEV